MKSEHALRHLLLRRLARQRLNVQDQGDLELDARLAELAEHLRVRALAEGAYEVEWRWSGQPGTTQVAAGDFRFYSRTGGEPDTAGAADALLRSITGLAPEALESPRARRRALLVSCAPYAFAAFAALAAIALVARTTLPLWAVSIPLLNILLVFSAARSARYGWAGALLAATLTLLASSAAGVDSLLPHWSACGFMTWLLFLQQAEDRHFRAESGVLAGAAIILISWFQPAGGALVAGALALFLALAPWLFPHRFARGARLCVLAGTSVAGTLHAAFASGMPALPGAVAGPAAGEAIAWALLLGASALFTLISWTTGTHRSAVAYFLPLFATAHIAGCWLAGAAPYDGALLGAPAALLGVSMLRWAAPLLLRRPSRAPREVIAEHTPTARSPIEPTTPSEVPHAGG